MSEHWVDGRLRDAEPGDDGSWATSPEGEALFERVQAEARSGRATSVRAGSGRPRALLAAAAVVVLALGVAALVLAGDKDDGTRVRTGDPAGPTTTTASTEPSVTSPTTTTSVPPPPTTVSTSTPTPGPTTTLESFPTTVAEYTAELVRAWGRGDRADAARYAPPDVVAQLFAFADPGGPGWDLSAPCEGAAGTTFCSYRDPARSETVAIGIPTGNGNVPDGPQEVSQVVISGG
jgi:hypothetical protein